MPLALWHAPACMALGLAGSVAYEARNWVLLTAAVTGFAGMAAAQACVVEVRPQR